MKNFLIIIFLFFILNINAFAVEIYSNGDTKVDIYADLRVVLQYSFTFQGKKDEKINGVSSTGFPTDYTLSHDMILSPLNKSNIGTYIKINQFESKIELGLNEPTFFNGPAAAESVGLRYIWGAWNFKNGGRLLFGKTDTPTSMIGFSSDIFNNDAGLYGTGGSTVYHRRFQIQYSIKGLTLALIEDDRLIDNEYFLSFNLADVYTPRAAVSYVYENETILAKFAATYTAYNGSFINNDLTKKWLNLHAFGIVIGFKSYFQDKSMWLSFQARYGMNEDMYGETAFTYSFNGTRSYNVVIVPYVDLPTNTFFNNHRIGTTFEYGAKINDKFTVVAGLGAQADFPSLYLPNETSTLSSYAVFLQGQYSLSDNFMLVSQVAYYGSVIIGKSILPSFKYTTYEESNALMAGIQFRVIF